VVLISLLASFGMDNAGENAMVHLDGIELGKDNL
jgi:hypothetical protein